MDTGRQQLDFDGSTIRGEEPFAILESHGEPHFFDELRARLQESGQFYPEGGAIGFFSYEATRTIEPRSYSQQRHDDLNLPLARLVFYRRLSYQPNQTASTPATPLELIPFPDNSEARHWYQSGVQTIKDYIAAGDIYQANLTRRFSFETPFTPATIYQRLGSLGIAPHAALLEWKDFSLVSNSPETFLTLRSGVLEAKPIKGTIRRGSTPTEDKQRKDQLAHSAKNRAENVMIVDLLRNDLGRVCEFGSVEVPHLYAIETFPTLHHGISTVRGKLRSDCDALDAFLAAFPCGSITGAPKIRAMQILSELEPHPRGASMGSIGYFAFNGDMKWSVAIRTATVIGTTAHFHVGGGIVADSEPADEYEEMCLKARALYSAIVPHE
jgi:para-aminobenzoate synthetase component 1